MQNFPLNYTHYTMQDALPTPPRHQVFAPRILEIQKRYQLSARQMYHAGAIVQNYSIVRLPSGNYQIESESRPGQFHQVNPKHESCTCEYAKGGNMCAHLAAWVYVREMDFHVGIGYAQDAKRLADFARAARSAHRDTPQLDPIARREQNARSERAARPRTEWKEGLDQ